MRIIAGRWKGRRLKAVRGRDVRPTSDRVRESWMGAIGQVVSGARVLDLFAGSGALGLEALSRGASSVVFVERSRGALATLRANVHLLDAMAQVTIVADDAIAFSEGLAGGAYDLALADPPYGKGLATRLIEVFRKNGFASQLWVEHPTTDAMPDLPGLRQRRYGRTVISIVEATHDA